MSIVEAPKKAEEPGYIDKLQSGLKYVAEAGESGRKSVDSMLGPVNGAISQFTGAAAELESLPFVGGAIGAKLQRITGAIGKAQAKVGQVLAMYGRATRAITQVQERFDVLKGQVARVKAVATKLINMFKPKDKSAVSTAVLAPKCTPEPEAVKAFPHLMIMQSLTPNSVPYYFNMDTTAFDELRRSTAFRWASQERLTRRPAQQAVGMGDEKMTLKGAIFGVYRGGIKQIDTLRTIGKQLKPLSLTTGYGAALGNWCLTKIEEEQGGLLQGGIPRKQSFTLEFERYGDDMQNV